MLKSDGRVLRIAHTAYDIFVSECSVQTLTLRPTRLCPEPGLEAEILGIMLQYLNIRYELVSFKKLEDWGTLHANGSWTGLLKTVADGLIDTVSSGYVHTEDRHQIVAFAYPVYTDEPVMITHKQEPSLWSSALTAFSVFSPGLWVSLAVNLLVFILVMKFTYTAPHCHQPSIVHNTAWQMIRYFAMNTSVRCNLRQSTYAGNMNVFMTGLFVVVISNVYQCSLLTRILHPASDRLFNSVDELMDKLASNEIHLVSKPMDGWWYFHNLRVSNHSYYVKLRNILKNNPIRFEHNSSALIQRVHGGPYVLPVGILQARIYTNADCDLVRLSADVETTPATWGSFVFAKSSPWVKHFNRAIINNFDLIHNTIEKYMRRRVVSCEKYDRKYYGQALPLVTVSGVLIMLLVGCSLAVISFLIERCHRIKIRRKLRLIWRIRKESKNYMDGGPVFKPSSYVTMPWKTTKIYHVQVAQNYYFSKNSL